MLFPVIPKTILFRAAIIPLSFLYYSPYPYLMLSIPDSCRPNVSLKQERHKPYSLSISVSTPWHCLQVPYSVLPIISLHFLLLHLLPGFSCCSSIHALQISLSSRGHLLIASLNRSWIDPDHSAVLFHIL